MKKNKVMLYLFIICSMVLSLSKCEATLQLESSIQQRPVLLGKQLQMYNSSFQEIYQEVHQGPHLDVKKGKGTYGGGGLLRPRTGAHKNSDGGVAKPPSLLIMGISQLGVGLLCLLFFI